MADDPSVYGSSMNFFLPPSARIPGMPSGPPGLFDLLGNMGLGGAKPGTPEEEQRKRQQQQMGMAQYGMGMLQPRPAPAPPPMMPSGPPQPQQSLPATQVTPSDLPPTGYGMQGGYPMRQRRPMPYPFGRE